MCIDRVTEMFNIQKYAESAVAGGVTSFGVGRCRKL